MADLGNLHFGVHLKDYTDAEADKIKKKLENLSVKLTIDGKNVNISHTDLIKKQIEDAVKSVSVQSVKVDTSAVKAQVTSALQGINPQISVTLLKGSLGNDLQNYLNSRTFNVGISISKSDAQNAARTAFANVSVPVNVTISASAVAQQMRQSLGNVKVKVGVEAKDVNTFIADVEKKLKGKKIKVDVEPNQQHLVQAVKQSLQGVSVKAQVKVDVDAQAITRAVQSAINNANFTYNPSGKGGRGGANANSAASSQRNLGNAYHYAAQGAYQSARASVSLGRSLSTNIRIAGELGTALGNLASIFGVKDLLYGIVQIGGQLENQRIALGAILQDGGKATEMFSKIQSLAVKSPFGIMDLNQYTKQLSAYGIEYNELYETMKRMADISAGVGVDMGRIILAFGQVKAAGFLKGTELRQFTEANIPMVEKLAEKFSLLEKRIVSAGEVYDMISEKKVTFEDVKDVLWGLTDEGGMFNNMQEVLSESLASKWKNLSDAIDVMYGKMADGMMGSSLKGVAELLTEMTKRWEYVATAIASATVSYMGYKAAVTLGSKQMAAANGLYSSMISDKRKEAAALRIEGTYRKLNKAEQQLIATTNTLTNAEIKQAIRAKVLNKEQALRLVALGKLNGQTLLYTQRVLGLSNAEIKMAQNATWGSRAIVVLGNAFRSLGAAMKSLLANPMTWIFGALTAGLEMWNHYSQKQDEIKQRNDEMAESSKGAISTLESELKKLNSIEIGGLNEDELRIKVNEISTIIKNETNGWQSMLSEVFAKDADGNFVNSAYKQLEMLDEKMKDILEAKRYLLDNPELASNVIEGTDGWIDESVVVNTRDYANAISEVKKQAMELAPYNSEISRVIKEVSFYNPKLSKELEGKKLYEQLLILRRYKEEWADFVAIIGDSDTKNIDKIVTAFNTIAYKSEGKRDTLLDDISEGIKVLKKAMEADGVDVNNVSEKWKQIIINVVTKTIDEAGVQEPKLRQAILDMWLGAFNINNDLGYVLPEVVVTPEKYDPSKDEVAKLWKKRAEEIDKAVKMYDKWKEVEGSDKARARVQAKAELANLFSGAYGFKLDLENPTAAYEFIQSKLNKNLSAQKELMVQLGVKISDAEFKDAQDKLRANMELLKREAEKTIQGWDLYKRLFEATGDKETSMSIAFGGQISFKDKLEHLRNQIETELGKIGATIPFEKLIGMDTKDLEAKGLGGLSDLIEKYNSENAKLKEESVKDFIDIIEASKDFAAQIEDIEQNLEKDLKNLRANANGADTSRAEAQLRKNAAEAISKVNFEEFKQSSDWIRVFGDLNRVSDATLDNMITKIEEFARHGKMSEEVTKQIVDAMAKLRKETIERNPFEGFEDAWKRLKYFKGLRSKVGEYDEHGKLITQQMVDDGIAEANDDLEKSSLAVADKFQAVANAADLLSGIFDGLGIDIGGLKDVLGGIAGGAQSGAGIAAAFGASGPWGAIAGAAVGAISTIFAQVDKNLQKEIEASERREKEVSNLSNNLKKALDRNMGGIYTMKMDEDTQKLFGEVVASYKDMRTALQSWNSGNVGWDVYEDIREFGHLKDDTIKAIEEAFNSNSYYDSQYAALKIQRDEVQKQMDLEEEKKKTDKSKIEDYKQELYELDDAIKNFAADMADVLYGINFKDWADQLAESMVDAWASGEDAAEAYRDTVKDILKNLGVSVISQKILQPLLEKTMNDFLSQFDKDNGVLTDNSMKILSGMLEQSEYAAKATETYLEGLKKLGIDLSSTSEDAKDGLSKSIQSVTEDTADLLASYVNGMRADLSMNRTLIEQLVSVDVPKMSYLAEAQLQQLQMVVANTKRNADAADRIYDLVNRVVDKGSNKLKV